MHWLSGELCTDEPQLVRAERVAGLIRGMRDRRWVGVCQTRVWRVSRVWAGGWGRVGGV